VTLTKQQQKNIMLGVFGRGPHTPRHDVSSRGFNYLKGKEHNIYEQNPNTNSPWAKMVREKKAIVCWSFHHEPPIPEWPYSGVFIAYLLEGKLYISFQYTIDKKAVEPERIWEATAPSLDDLENMEVTP